MCTLGLLTWEDFYEQSKHSILIYHRQEYYWWNRWRVLLHLREREVDHWRVSLFYGSGTATKREGKVIHISRGWKNERNVLRQQATTQEVPGQSYFVSSNHWYTWTHIHLHHWLSLNSIQCNGHSPSPLRPARHSPRSHGVSRPSEEVEWVTSASRTRNSPHEWKVGKELPSPVTSV